jgi:hypothetical protein
MSDGLDSTDRWTGTGRRQRRHICTASWTSHTHGRGAAQWRMPRPPTGGAETKIVTITASLNYPLSPRAFRVQVTWAVLDSSFRSTNTLTAACIW